MIKLLVLDDQKVYRDGLILNLHNSNFIDILEVQRDKNFELENKPEVTSDELLDEIISIMPDVIIIDAFYKHGNKLFLIKKLLKKAPYLKIIILSNERGNIYLNEVEKNGVKAFLSKSDNFDEVLNCILEVAKGSNKYYEKMLKEKTNSSPVEPGEKITLLINSLNFTEYEILKLLAERKKIFEIAAILKISERKVYQYKSSMMSKLNLTSGLELLKIFLDNE